MATAPTIFDENIQTRQSRLQSNLELALGRKLAAGDIETLILNSFAYEVQLVCIQGNLAYQQNLVAFATGVMLDNLGALVGVDRLPAQGSTCTIQFNLVEGHNAVQIPANIRVQSVDGLVIFLTTSAVDVPIGTNTATVAAICSEAGSIGNNYTPGTISIILDPQAFISSAQNIDTTNSGIDAETDDQLRSRIALAPASFSVAGPKGAYIFFAKSAHPSIVDVACVTTQPGEVTLYPLCAGGLLPSDEIKAAVLAICDDYKVRPQNDTVLVASPGVITYSIVVELITYNGAIDADVLRAVEANLTAFTTGRLNKLGLDAVRSQITAQCMIPGQVYNATVVSPASDIIADEQTYAQCTGISVTITGSNDG